MRRPRKAAGSELVTGQINGAAGISASISVRAATGARLQASAGTDAKTDWRAGDETIKGRALAKVKAREAAEAADASYNAAVQSRLPRRLAW